jgi:hypothetical protein
MIRTGLRKTQILEATEGCHLLINKRMKVDVLWTFIRLERKHSPSIYG